MLTPLLLVFTLGAQSAVPSTIASPVPAATPASATNVAPVVLSVDEMSKFLATAKVVSHHGINKGVTNPIRLTLSDGATTHDAAFTYVDEHRSVMELNNGRTEINFVDSYKYSLAAYGVARLLGLEDMIPVTVPREYDNQPGALSWWVDVTMDEGERLHKKIQPPDENAWGAQIYRMRVFAALVADTDRNAGNILIGPEWKLWMIDFTRAFRPWKQPDALQSLTRCDKRLLGRLRALSAQRLEDETKPYLTHADIDALLARRDAIVKLFDGLIAQKGVAKILY